MDEDKTRDPESREVIQTDPSSGLPIGRTVFLPSARTAWLPSGFTALRRDWLPALVTSNDEAGLPPFPWRIGP